MKTKSISERVNAQFEVLWEELASAAGDNTMREWPELKEYCLHVYRCGAADGVANERERIERGIKTLSEALQPFAEMDREGGDLSEVACQRGTASDLTIITSADFRRARAALALAGEKQ